MTVTPETPHQVLDGAESREPKQDTAQYPVPRSDRERKFVKIFNDSKPDSHAQEERREAPSESDDYSGRLTYELRFKKLANAIHSAADFNAIMIGLREQILSVYQVEMATIYLIDGSRKEIFSWVLLPGDYLKKIRIPICTKSIAGYVAYTGKVVNIHDVYDQTELISIDPDLKFDDSWDKKTGSRTRQVLAVPILFRHSLLGVIQLINKRSGDDFTAKDQKHAFDLSETLGIAFHNQYRLAKKTPSKYDALVSNGVISDKELDRAKSIAQQQGKAVETILMHHFRVPKIELGSALAEYYHTEYEDLADSDHDPGGLIKGVNIDYFKNALCVPIGTEDDTAVLVIDDPHDQNRILEMRQILRISRVEVRFALREDIERYIERLKAARGYQGKRVADRTFADIIEEIEDEEKLVAQEEIERQSAEDRAIVLLVRKIIEDAYKHKASDIHIEPYGTWQDAEVRFRVDGRCTNVLNIPKNHIKAVVSRFKILANLDISERRRPQDGKIKLKTSEGKEIELRVSTIPTAEGNEDVVLRVLADSEPLPLKKIMPERIFKSFSEIVQKPYGIVLVVGPTGSGKTTTLHSALGFINTPDKKIWTAEDPVEITQYRLRQVQVNSKIGLTFAAAMRSFLRADPDVIMVGEMRDQETASMGIEASLTGHLVFSTLHTNSAPETITRLIDMGMDPFNFADALQGILAQRLVRTLCHRCRQAYRPERTEYEHLRQIYGDRFGERVAVPYAESLRFYRPQGCKACNNTGYRGRRGLYELLPISDRLRRLIIDRATVDDIREAAMEEGMSTLLQEGIGLVFSGDTDFNQVMSVCVQ